MNPDKSAALLAATQRRSQTTRDRAVATLRQLNADGADVTFSAVAHAAKVSRSWLYRQPDLRDEIGRLRTLRTNRSTPGVPSAERASTDSLRRRLEAGHDEIRRLKLENSQLREQVAQRYGQQRADGPT